MLKKTAIGLAASALALGLTTVVSTEGMATFGQTADPEEMGKKAKGSVFRDGHFHNTEETKMVGTHGFFKIMRKFYFTPTGKREPSKVLPIEPVDAAMYDTPPENNVRLTWMGHASVLIELDGKVILTDPSFSERASPVQWAGPKRFHPLPIAVDKLPPIDAIVISHDHYDHLDYHSIRKLAPKTRFFYVPLGVGDHLRRWGVADDKIIERDWWQEATLDNTITMAPTPAQHFSGRSLGNRNTTLWASWVILGKTHRIYFSGDTGMFAGFKEIGERYGPFDFTLMHIGAYANEWSNVHMDPEEAVQAHLDLKGKVFVPIHWGTFTLAFHDWNEPAERLYKAAQAANLSYVIPMAGQYMTNPKLPPVTPWWRTAG